jgi:hypothetical protein
MPSLNSLSFDTTAFRLQEDGDARRIWRTPWGDGVGVFLFTLPPDIEAAIESIDDVRMFYRSSAMAAGFGVIEIETPSIDRCIGVRTILKCPQQPHGMTYLGSITLPFRDFSFVVKAQCEEHGVTGVREAVVFDEMLASGKIRTEDVARAKKSGKVPGWMQDPYDATIKWSIQRNLAEDEQYDVRFPEHPLSRVRTILRGVQSSLHFAPEVVNAPPFVFRGSWDDNAKQRIKPPWWKIW